MQDSVKTPEPPIWTRDFIFLWFSGLFTTTAFYILQPMLPLYLNSLEYTETEIGWLIGIMTFSATLIRPLAGFLVDRFGRASLYLAAYALGGVLMAAYGLLESFIALAALRMAHGMTSGVMSTAGSTIAADLLPTKRRGEGIGYYFLTLSIAMAVGPVGSLYLIEQGMPHEMMFLSAAAMIGIGFLLACNVTIPAVKNTEARLTLNGVFERRVFALSLTMLMIALTYGAIITFIPIYGTETIPGGASWFYGIYAVMLMCVRPFSGKILDRHGPRILVTVSLLFMAAGYAAIFGIPNVFGMGLGGVLVGIGSGVTLPAFSAMVANRVDAGNRGRANATYAISLDVGIGVGAIGFGWLASQTDVGTVFAGAAIMCVLAMLHLMFWVIPRGLHEAYEQA